MLRPNCKASLGAAGEGGLEMLKWSHDHGAWLGKRTLERLANANDVAREGLRFAIELD